MSRQAILSQVASRFSQMGIPFRTGGETDIAVFTEFLDAGWSTGSRKIVYEASIFADESENTVFMWEVTREAGHGLSFGGESGSSFQSGATLFRKVKSVQYGPDGKAYEYTLNLGDIPKAVRDAARQYGWKFKTVLKKGKAMWPSGFTPAVVPDGSSGASSCTPPRPEPSGFCTNCGMPLNEGSNFCERCGKPIAPPTAGTTAGDIFYAQSPRGPAKSRAETVGLLAFVFLGVVAAIFFVLASVTLVGWIAGSAVFAVLLYLQRRAAKKKWFLSVMLWVLTALILSLVLAFSSPPEGSPDAPDSGTRIADAGDLIAKLPYEKSFTLSDGKSVGKFRLFVSDGTGQYEDIKGYGICEFSVVFDTSSLPADFKLKPEQATEQNAMGQPALDGLVMAVCSDAEAYHISSLASAGYIYNNGGIRPSVETEGATTVSDPGALAGLVREMAEKYPKMQVLRYNVNEVGMTKESENTWVTEINKAFGLHPPVVEGYMPWDEILADLGLK